MDIDVAKCEDLTDASFVALSTNCPHLRAVIMWSHRGVTDQGLRALSACKQLQLLWCCNCRNISDIGLLAIANNCPLLKSVAVIGCPLITDTG